MINFYYFFLMKLINKYPYDLFLVYTRFQRICGFPVVPGQLVKSTFSTTNVRIFSLTL